MTLLSISFAWRSLRLGGPAKILERSLASQAPAPKDFCTDLDVSRTCLKRIAQFKPKLAIAATLNCDLFQSRHGSAVMDEDRLMAARYVALNPARAAHRAGAGPAPVERPRASCRLAGAPAYIAFTSANRRESSSAA